MAPNPACQTFIPKLSPFIDGELDPAERIVVERHLTACKDCTMRAADLRAESGLLRVGMEMLADEEDFKDFSQKVMARITPERPPVFERIRISLSEMFTYQRGMMLTSMATAAVVLAIATPLILLRNSTPEGYASEQMMVQEVRTEEGARVSPVVLETKSGNSIIWLVDQPKVEEKKDGKNDEAQHEELDMDTGQEKPNGGEL
jgi:anti-sigma factor RsiW